jgi:hypothetical protein
MGLGRVELPTSRLSGVRSNHLSYRPKNGRFGRPFSTMKDSPSEAPSQRRMYCRVAPNAWKSKGSLLKPMRVARVLAPFLGFAVVLVIEVNELIVQLLIELIFLVLIIQLVVVFEVVFEVLV